MPLTEAEELELLELEEQEYQESLQKTPQVSGFESGLRGAAQGASLGFADEISGAVESAFTDKTYEQARDESRQAYTTAEQANPGTYMAGQIGGGIATAFVPGLNVAKGASLGGGLLKAAGVGAGLGALGGAGASTAEDSEGVLKDAAVSGLVGAGAGAAGQGLSVGVQKLINSGMFPKLAAKFGKKAEESAAAGLGLERGTFKKMGEEKVRQVGRYALDEGLVDAGLGTAKNPFNLISGSAATEAMQDANQAAMSKFGSIRDSVYGAIDDSVGAGAISTDDIVQNIRKQAGGFDERMAINAPMAKRLNDIISDVKLKGDSLSMRQAQELVEEFKNLPNWNNNVDKAVNNLSKDAYRAIRGTINESAGNLAERLGTPGAKESIMSANRNMAAGYRAKELLNNRAAREQGNQILGLTDTIFGGAAGAMGAATTGLPGVLLGAGAVAANKALNRYGNLGAASVANNLSKIVQKTPQMLGKYAPALQQAAQRGGNSLAATNYLLMQKEPEYRELMRKMENQDGQ